MNKVYKVIWNHATQTWVAVSEIAQAKGKTSSKTDKRAKLSKVAAVVSLAVAGSALIGGQVQAATPVTSSGTIIEAWGGNVNDNPPLDTDGMTGLNANTMALGPGSFVHAAKSIAIGHSAQVLAGGGTSGAESVAIGVNAITRGKQATALGEAAEAAMLSTATGQNAKAVGYASIATGQQSNASAAWSTATGVQSKASASYANALGGQANASSWGSTALGTFTVVNGDEGTAVGYHADVTGRDGTASGAQSVAAEKATATGAQAKAGGTNATASGFQANASGANAVAAGVNSSASGESAVAVGRNTTATKAGATAVGNEADATGDYATAMGHESNASGNNALALGRGTIADQADSVALGSNSKTTTAIKTPNKVIGTFDYKFDNHSVSSTVSVGNDDVKRTITNVAAGRLDATSTDAINGSQLYAVAKTLGGEIESTYFHANTNTAQGAGDPVSNKGRITDKAGATGVFSVTAGVNATANAPGATAIGHGAKAYWNQGIALGQNATIRDNSNSVEAHGAIAIGGDSNTQGKGGIAIGRGATSGSAEQVQNPTGGSHNEYAIAIGDNATSKGENSIAIGRDSNITKSSGLSVAVGSAAKITATEAVAIGSGSNALAQHASSLGRLANATSISATAIGANSKGLGIGASAFGALSNASGRSSTAVGHNAQATAHYATSLGRQANATSENALALGEHTQATAKNAIAIGSSDKTVNTAVATDDRAYYREISVTNRTEATAENAIAIGYLSQAKGRNSIAVGVGHTVEADNAGAFGDPSHLTAEAIGSYAVGNNNTITSANTFVLGSGINRNNGLITEGDGTVANSVYLGNESEVTGGSGSVDQYGRGTLETLDKDQGREWGNVGDLSQTTAGATGRVNTAKINGVTYGSYNMYGPPEFAGAEAKGAVTVGAGGMERRIQNVAAGEISKTSTDAINGSQLYAVADQASKPIRFTANSNKDTANTTMPYIGGNGLERILGDTINIQGATKSKDLSRNTDAATDSTYSARNVQTVVDNQGIQIQIATNPIFDSVQFGSATGPKITNEGANIKVGDSTGAATKITNVANGTSPNDAVNLSQLSANRTSVAPGDNTHVKTSDLAGGGTTYTVHADKAVVQGGNGVNVATGVATDATNGTKTTTYTVTANVDDTTIGITTDGKLYSKVSNTDTNTDTSAHVKAADGGLATVTKADVTRADGITQITDYTVDVKKGTFNNPSTTGELAAGNTGVATVADVVEAVNKGFLTTKVGGNQVEQVGFGDDINFVDGKGTTARIVDGVNGDKGITFDANLVSSDNSISITDKDGAKNLTVNTGVSTVEDGGKAVTTDGDQVANLGDVIETINKTSWKVNSTAQTGGEGTYTANEESKINAGDTLNIDAGKNIKISGAGNTLLVETKDDVTFDEVTTRNLTATGDTVVKNFTVQPQSTINMGNNQIKGVAEGTDNTDAVM